MQRPTMMSTATPERESLFVFSSHLPPLQSSSRLSEASETDEAPDHDGRPPALMPLPLASPEEECVLIFRGSIEVAPRRGTEDSTAARKKRCDAVRAYLEELLFVEGMARVGVCVADVQTAPTDTLEVEQAEQREPFLYITAEPILVDFSTKPLLDIAKLIDKFSCALPTGWRSRRSQISQKTRWTGSFVVLSVCLNLLSALLGTFASNWSSLAPVQQACDISITFLLAIHLLFVCSRAVLAKLLLIGDVYFLLLCTAAQIAGTIAASPISGVYAFATRVAIFSLTIITLDAAVSVSRTVRGSAVVYASMYNAFVTGWNMYFGLGSDAHPHGSESDDQTVWIFHFFRMHALTVITSSSSFLCSYFAQNAFRLLYKQYDAMMLRFPFFFVSGQQLLRVLAAGHVDTSGRDAPSQSRLALPLGDSGANPELDEGAVRSCGNRLDVCGVVPLVYDPTGVIHKVVLEETQKKLASIAEQYNSPADTFAIVFSIRRRSGDAAHNVFGQHIAATPRTEDVPLFSPLNRHNALWYATSTPRHSVVDEREENDGAERLLSLMPVRSQTVCSAAPLCSLAWFERALHRPAFQIAICATFLILLVCLSAVSSQDSGFDVARIAGRYTLGALVALCASQLDRDLLRFSVASIDFWLLFFQILLVDAIDAYVKVECGFGIADGVARVIVGCLLALTGASVDSFLMPRRLKGCVTLLFGVYNLAFVVVAQKLINDGACGSEAHIDFYGFSIHLLTLQQSLFFTLGYCQLKFAHRFFIQGWQCVFLVFGAKRVDKSRDQLLRSVNLNSQSMVSGFGVS